MMTTNSKAVLQARMDRLKQRMKAIEEKERQEADRLALLAGRTALRIAARDASFSATLRAGLEADLTRPKDRALFDLPSGIPDAMKTSGTDLDASVDAGADVDAPGS